ncbi:hypothetical protein MLD38_020112 [Melastoma candidum]|uniref:Uncharacterized protein n=1 Tax=Melastoma candidum TaxID=119954 RepID=A0ACB9QCB2_9MYRT|nr:hypothetical protein MLD38_020112 [Melastoma candidum]
MDETTLDAKDASFRENGHKLVLGRERLTIWGEPGATGASQKYEKAVKCIEFDHSFSDEEKSTATAFRLSCYLNNAAFSIPSQSILFTCHLVLELDPGNIKTPVQKITSESKDFKPERSPGQMSIQPHNREVKHSCNKN